MKVIVQDIQTGGFLSDNGQWVATQADARDFFTLLRAFAFAQKNTSVHFKVLLHCPEDQYCATIIDGQGMANTQVMACASNDVATAKVQTETITVRHQMTPATTRNIGSHTGRFNWTANPWN